MAENKSNDTGKKKSRPTEEEMAIKAEKYFRRGVMNRKGATPGEANRFGNMKSPIMDKKAAKERKKQALRAKLVAARKSAKAPWYGDEPARPKDKKK